MHEDECTKSRSAREDRDREEGGRPVEGSQLQEKASGDLRTGNCLTGTSGVWDRPSFACEQAVSSRSSFCLLPQPWVLAA
ncbi:MAG: hypothetical protein ACPIOQ_39255, partial [Promethearchaeia archaeon]